jgi:glycosyltransferase involved in cell wall biosynthesis
LSSSVHHWAPAFRSFGGGVAALNRDLALAIAGQATIHLAGKLDDTGEWNGLPLWGARRCPPLGRSAFFAGGLAVLAARDRPRLVVCGHVNFGPVALALQRTLGIPYVVLAFGVEIGPHLSLQRMRALRSAEAVWAISRWTAERVRATGVPEERVRILPVTLREEAFDVGPSSSELRTRLGISADERVILTIARLDSTERYKGYDNVLRALPLVLREVGPVRYLVVGRGDDATRLQSLASALGMAAHVTLPGFVPDTELADYYHLADAFAMPSTGEGFGIVYLEAMACGVPVLGGNRDGAVDALGNGELGLLVEPTSVDAIAEGLVRLLKREGPALWFDPSGLRNRCLELFGKGAFTRRVDAAISTLLAGRL